MAIVKRILLFLVNFVFRFSLFFGLSLLAAVLVLSKPDTIKNVLDNADAHNRFLQSVVDSSKTTNFNNPNSIPLDNPQISQVIKNSLDPKSLTKITDDFVDSSYDWLNGKTKTIEFSADLSTNKQVLAEGVASFAVERIASLSPCTSVPKETNVFKVECNPTGVDLGVLRQDIIKTIVNDKSVFPNDKITIDNLPKTADGRTLTEGYPKVPHYFQLFLIAPYILLSISFILALIIVFTARTKRRGLKTIGSSLLGTAIIMAISPLLYLYVLPMLGFKTPNFNSSNESISAIVNDATTELYSSFNSMLINVAFQVAIAGISFMIISKFLKSNSSMYLNLEKKAGLAPSEKTLDLTHVHQKLPNIPLQTSESNVKKEKKISELEKKYRKM